MPASDAVQLLRAALRCKPCCARRCPVCRFPPRSPAGAEYVTLEQLLAESDLVSLHCPLMASTFNLLNAERCVCATRGLPKNPVSTTSCTARTKQGVAWAAALGQALGWFLRRCTAPSLAPRLLDAGCAAAPRLLV